MTVITVPLQTNLAVTSVYDILVKNADQSSQHMGAACGFWMTLARYAN